MSAAPTPGLELAVTGSWAFTIDSDDLSAGAGSDFTSSHLSAVDELVIEVSGALDQFEAWYLDVHSVVTNWSGEFSLGVMRTSDGAGAGVISGGTILQTLDGVSRPFFEGAGDRSSVFVRIVLSGATVATGSDLFTAEIVFTLRDTN